jgi:hypothetical protein
LCFLPPFGAVFYGVIALAPSLFLKQRKEAKENARPLRKPQSRKQKKILPINSIPVVIQYSSTIATSRPSEIGRTSISGSFSLLLSFGETKERRENCSPCFATKPFQGQKENLSMNKY